MSMNGQLWHIPAEHMDALDDEAVVESIMEADGLHLGKEWNGVHYLLCGEGATGESAVLGGTLLDGPDAGYGPPQFLTPAEVAAYAKQLAETTDDELRAAYDPDGMRDEEVHGGDWDDPDEVERLIAAARRLRAFYQDAAARGCGMLQQLV
jgi:hypothetical protein